jgi:hypothetical protein
MTTTDNPVSDAAEQRKHGVVRMSPVVVVADDDNIPPHTVTAGRL